MQDHKQRFLFPDSDIRGELVQVESSVSRILEGHSYPLPVQGLIGEAVAAVALLASTLKFKGRLALQAQGKGPVSLLLAECSHDGELRALARHSDGQDWSHGDIQTLIGEGTMVITITPDQGRQYQGIVPLEGDTLAQCLEGYFQQSEQLPTRLWLAAGNGRAAGLMLQRLPDQVASRDENRNQWEHLEALAGTLKMEELLDLPAELHQSRPDRAERDAGQVAGQLFVRHPGARGDRAKLDLHEVRVVPRALRRIRENHRLARR